MDIVLHSTKVTEYSAFYYIYWGNVLHAYLLDFHYDTVY
jgi:hypothetical protein